MRVRRFPKSVVGVVGLVSGLALGAAATMVSGQTREAAPQSNRTDASSRGVSQPTPESAYDPEFCEILERWNSDKKISADGSVSTMTRPGASRHWGDPHENLNGNHKKDWKGTKK